METNANDIKFTRQLVFYVNGKEIVERNPDPETTLLQYLRLTLGLTGTKLGCGEGGCGACTVMISKYDRSRRTIRHMSVNACLFPLCSLHGLAVTTVEGIGSIKNGLHPLQESLAKSHGTQCGFCTPGIIMSMYTLLRNKPTPSVEDVEKALDGNLCRCTGYRSILEGFRAFTRENCPLKEKCCKNFVHVNGVIQNGEIPQQYISDALHPTQDPIFPPKLQMSDRLDKDFLVFESKRVKWMRPVTLNELLELKDRYSEAKLVVGNTELGIETKFKGKLYPVVIDISHIPALLDICHTEHGIKIGASVSLAETEKELKRAMRIYPEHKARSFAAVLEMLRWFAGNQIRNVASLAGNIITASPVSDLNPLLLACGAVLELQSRGKQRRLTIDEDFFVGYRKTVVKPCEVLINVLLPFTAQDEYFAGYKQAYRREDDIATVNAGMRVLFHDNSDVIKDLVFAFGGMAPKTVMAKQTMLAVVGRRWDETLANNVCCLLSDDLPLSSDAPGGMPEYRRTLAVSFWFKFYLFVQYALSKRVNTTSIPESFTSAVRPFHREPSSGSQVYKDTDPSQPDEDLVGRPVHHLSARKQTTGEAAYIDDMPTLENELHIVFVTSTRAFAIITKVDPSEALTLPGVVDYVNYKDVPGTNMWGHIIADEEIFASKQVFCQGQIIGGIVAESRIQAQRAAKHVKVEYEELKPIITIKTLMSAAKSGICELSYYQHIVVGSSMLVIEEAIKAESFHGKPMTINTGDVDSAFIKAEHVVEGDCHIGGQEHFYLETHSTIAIPKGEDGEIELFVSTQNLMDTQLVTASALGVPANRIMVRVKRLGGGFGGKETRSNVVSAPAAVAANKLQRPVRAVLDRDEDMLITGSRHPFYASYKAGFDNLGKILALKVTLYSNAGMSMDLSSAVMKRALYHLDNAYKIDNIRCTGYCCKTNIPSNTAFRGFGGPQAMMVIEQILTEYAYIVGVSPVKIRQLNLYQEGDITYYEQQLTDCHIRECWDKCLEQSNYTDRKKKVDAFNRSNRWKKRGISVVPTKFGISYIGIHLNQAGALVHIYSDGSVLLTHGGVEMGQGLYTKMIQVASRALNIPASKIHTLETTTQAVPNVYATAASCGSDLNGMAILNACEILLERLKTVMEDIPNGTWEKWIKEAYKRKISLSVTGFYRTPGLGYDHGTHKGTPFSYFTCGAACSEVEIDCLTGDHQVLRTDIVMDVGASLNPAIDVGQIEGAFVQGYGMMMMEQQKFSADGYLFSRGPSTYKIPGVADIPAKFNVSLLKGSANKKAVYSSKAVGEPPLFLASSVFFAVKDAILAARKDVGLLGNFKLPSPATPERIRMACEDQFTEMCVNKEDGPFKPWFVEP